MKEKRQKREKGITLVALIVTIIILIILAGISINFVLGENGLFGRALQARDDMEKAEKDEQETFNALLAEIDKWAKGEEIKKLTESKGKYFDKQTTLEDSNGNKVVVPEGFKIAEDSGDNVTEGIVIEDQDIKEGIGNDRGNQYVWIPVSNIDGKGSNPIKKSDGKAIEITLGRYEFADGTSIYNDEKGNPLNGGSPLAAGTEILRQSAQEFEMPKIIETDYQELNVYQEGNAVKDLTGKNRTALDLAGFIDSVRKNSGYYIARYEASYGEGGKPKSKVSSKVLNENGLIPTEEGTLWSNITEIDAAQKCENIYTTVSSDLVNSYAWDTAIVYIQKFSDKTSYSRQISENTGNIANTGENGDEACKIQDMASNCREWTTENSTYKTDSDTAPCVVRGGSSLNVSYYTSLRFKYDATINFNFFTFRTMLYIKK